MDYAVFGGQNVVIWYEDIAQGSNFYYYPLDLEMKLAHTIKNGDVESLEQILYQLEEQNHTERQLSATTRKQLVSEIQGTLYKLMEQLQFGYATYSELNAKLEFMQNNSEQHWATVKSALQIVCHHINDNKKQKHHKMADDMMEIVHTQYLDANFGLANLADHFKCSERFISVQFKEYASKLL